MNKLPYLFDWNHARAFLVTAEEGSLSAAAKLLGQRQPTLSRQVASLEQDLGVVLFERIGKKLILTQSGIGLLEHFQSMGEAASHVSLTASGQSQTIQGRVTITATDVMATYYLPPILNVVRKKAPEIEIDIIASNDIYNLRRREADIAIRHVEPEEPNLVAALISQTSCHLYATRQYLKRHEYPQTISDLSNADFIGFEHPERFLLMLENLGISLTRNNVKLSSESGTVYVALVRAGLGIGLLSKEFAKTIPDIQQVLPELEPIPIPIWLVTHSEMHTSRRIRFIFDLLAEEIPKLECVC